MRDARFKKTLIFCVTALFLMVSVLALAAGKPWFVIKDSRGVCKVIQAKERTQKTIAGPFATKAEALKAKDDNCPKAAPVKREPTQKQF